MRQSRFFDPLGILDGSTVEKVQYYRDAELKHVRIGTIAAIGILSSEAFHPFGGEELNGVPALLAFPSLAGNSLKVRLPRLSLRLTN